MIPNIVGFLFIGSWAAFFFIMSYIIVHKHKSVIKNYSAYPKIEADIVKAIDNRWVVEFKDESGETVLGMEDEILCSYFRKNIKRVRRHTKEWVYYWPYDRKGAHYRINGKEMKYSIHFCNPEYAEQRKKRRRFEANCYKVVGAILTILAFAILFFGNGI
jgi:hypothetical protein